MVILKDEAGNEFYMELPITMTLETYEFENKQYEIKPSYLWDEEVKQKDRTRIKGAVMIGKDGV